MPHTLTLPRADEFAAIALEHVTRQYPNKLDHVMETERDIQGPQALHPIFYGSFDWHSCVHGWWLLARLLRRCPELPQRQAIRSLFDQLLTPANVDAELNYFNRPWSRGFERPYGWAWLLMLAAEFSLHRNDHGEVQPWTAILRPLARAIAQRLLEFLPNAIYPIRSGAHANTAFAATLAHIYAAQCDPPLKSALSGQVLMWYSNDADCQAWEPSLDDFLSPALMEARCMRQFLPPAEFEPWFARFLPRLQQGEPATLFRPATVPDRTDGKIAHLDGLNLSRAWCWRGIAAGLSNARMREIALAAAERHLDASLPHLNEHYMGGHWLATFALLALENA